MAGRARIVPDLLRWRANEQPAGVAFVVDGGERLVYRSWEARSNGIARGLVERGVAPGDRLGLVFDGAEWCHYAVSYLAAHKAGAVAVPLSSSSPAPELHEALRRCGASGVLSCSGRTAWTDGWAAHPSQLGAGHSTDAFQVAVGDYDMAEIIYTSGTTGAPKGVVCSHRSVLVHDPPPDPAGDETAWVIHAFPIGTHAAQELLRVPLRRGDRTVLVMPAFDADRLCQLVEERRIRRLQLVPSMAIAILSSKASQRYDLSSVERVTLSSAPAPPSLFARLANVFPCATMWNAYALTEGGTARTLMQVDGRRPGSVGRPVGATEICVVDDDGEEVASGVPGEVRLRRTGAPKRWYFGDPVATAAAYSGDWLRTGDIGFLDEGGYLFLIDRRTDLIISGGLNVSSTEVEGVLVDHPRVVDAAVFGLPHPVLGQVVAAAVTTSSGIDARDVQVFVRTRLSEHKVPQQVFVVDSLPRNPAGKVLKRQLTDTFSEVAGRHGQTPPRTSLERKISAVWMAVLDREDIGVDADFFALGGSSLAAAQIVASLRDTLGVRLEVAAVFAAPTIAELASVVERLPAPSLSE